MCFVEKHSILAMLKPFFAFGVISVILTFALINKFAEINTRKCVVVLEKLYTKINQILQFGLSIVFQKFNDENNRLINIPQNRDIAVEQFSVNEFDKTNKTYMLTEGLIQFGKIFFRKYFLQMAVAISAPERCLEDSH